MPPKYKSKKRAYDSSEDEPQSSKKSKVISTEAKKDGDGNTYWELSGTRRVQISDFKGKHMVSIREFYQKDGEFLPGKKGISLPLDQFTALMAVLPQVFGHLSQLGENVPIPDFEASHPGTKKRDETTLDDQEEDDDADEDHKSRSAANGTPTNKLDRLKHDKQNHESTSEEEP